MSTFITRLESSGDGPRLAVKDIIDVAGVVTTAGCAAVAFDAKPAERDAACLAGARAANARIVGKANTHELALGASGVNNWSGTPVNPLDASLVPGGSSSGSAVAVATGEADVAYGSDTGGSIRIPAACCGVAGLKITWGRIPLDGVWPLAPSLDTIGVLARDIAGLELGMRLLEPAFQTSGDAPRRIGRLRVDALPEIDAAVDKALRRSDLEVVEVALPGWIDARYAAATILIAEGAVADARLMRDHADLIDPDVLAGLLAGAALDPAFVIAARETCAAWRRDVEAVLAAVDVIALPALPTHPPPLGTSYAECGVLAHHTLPVNAAGLPALVLPVPGPRLPIGLQFVGPARGEALLLAAGAMMERALA